MSSVLITGANRGIGLEFARQYAVDGWRVHACCRDPRGARALAAALKGHDGVIHRLDVTDQDAIHALVEALDDEPLDVLVNNAGIIGGDRQAFGDIDHAMWERTIETNVFGPYRVAEALADRVAASERRIIANISSLMGSIADNASGGRYVYRSSKTALNMVVVNLARALVERGITVLAFHPGWVQTDMGGANAPVTPHDSVAGMRQVIETAGPEQSGRFINYDGRLLAW
jgi:NAD(P)-dependent dehydrogenase (short-subunit alcohol dehydrogenase family)